MFVPKMIRDNFSSQKVVKNLESPQSRKGGSVTIGNGNKIT